MDSAMSEKEFPGYDARSVRSSFTSSGSTTAPQENYANEREMDQYRNVYGAIIDTTYMQPGGDDAYDAKVKLLNEAVLDMGMGRYQWLLTIVTGLGWFLDSFWMFSFAFIQPAIEKEAKFYVSNAAFLTVCQYVGLTIGAAALPMMSDFIGRKLIFNFSLGLMCIAGLVGAGMPSFSGLCVVAVFMSIATGGNQAVDSAIFLEIIPASHQYLLTMQGMYSGLGKVVAALVAWPLMTKFSCSPDAESCHYVNNMGWRYSWWTLGAITVFFCIIRYFFFLHETPKFLLGQGRDAEVVDTVNAIAAFNKKDTWLTLEQFQQIEKVHGPTATAATPNTTKLRQCLLPFRPRWLKGVFCTKRLTLSTNLLIAIWALIGIAFPLHTTFTTRYLVAHNRIPTTYTTDITAATFQSHIYQGLCAIPGPLLAAFLIESPALGRKKTGAAATIIAGALAFLHATSRSANDLLAWSCVAAFFQNAVVSLMFTYAPETFAAPIRGTGMGVIGFFARAAGLVAAIVAALTESAADAGGAAMWVGAAAWVVAGLLWFGLPYEMRGRATN